MTTISSAGIGSGLDVESIVTALVNAEKGPLTSVTTQISSYQTKLSAYGTLKSALSSFQSSLSSLVSATKFSAQTATSSDTSIFTATATGKATAGDYSINVTQLAQAQKLSASGFSSTSDTVGTGTLSISFGTYSSTGNTFTANTGKTGATITIDSTNNTLSGVRDAINAAGIDVTASIVNDGTTNRLVITSKTTGEASSLKISVTDDDGTSSDASGLSQLAYDPTSTSGSGKNMTELQAAKNALLTIDGISISKATNTISDALEGVTLNLLKVSDGDTINLNVERDSDTITKSVQAFVDAYNTLNSKITSLTKYDAETETKGELLGDATTRSISMQLKSMVTQTISNNGTLTSLSQIGVGFQRDGTLALDTDKLDDAIENNFSDIASLFAATGTSSDTQVEFVRNSETTKAGSYAVTVTQLATQGSLVGSSAPNLTITDGVNDTLNLSIGGSAYTLDITAGTYASVEDLAAEVQTRILSAGSNATVTVEGGALKIINANYGSGTSVSVTGGNAASDLLGSSPTSTDGVDVAGTINGVAAVGVGRNLKAADGNDAEGLVLKITGGALGSRGTLTFSTGYAYQLNTLMDSMLDTDGILESKTDSINDSIDRLEDRQDDLEARLLSIEARYRAQYTALDTLMSSLNTTSTYLTQQLASLNSSS